VSGQLEQDAPAGRSLLTDGPVLDGNALTQYEPVEVSTRTAQEIAAFAAAVGETNPSRLAGLSAPPTYAFVPFTDVLFEAFDRLLEPEARGRLVHTRQWFALHRPILAGDTLRVTGRVSRLVDGPFGAVLEVSGALTTQDGSPVADQVATLLVPGAVTVNPIGTPESSAGEPAAAGLLGESSARPAARRGTTLELDIPRDLPARYADASGDRNPLHLDPAAARQVGFPGVVVHGMATFALAIHAVESALPGCGDVRELEVEFTRPVFPAERLTLRFESGEGGVAFDVANRRRRTVLRGGRVRFDPADTASTAGH
jgi:acyl dehydratase